MFLYLFAIAIVFLVVYWYVIKPKNLPPGPSGIPVFGYLPWMLYYANDRMKLVDSLKKYGNVICIRVGFNYMLFLNDMDTVKEAFVNKGDYFSGRGLRLIQHEITKGKGILSSEGRYQRENKRFILKTLRNMGFGKISFEEPILDSIKIMFKAIDDHISTYPNESFDFKKCLIEAVAENITRIVLGIKFSNEELQRMIQRLKVVESVPQMFFMMNSFPFLLPLIKFKFFKKLIGLQKFKEIRVSLENFIKEIIKNHKSTFDRDQITDLIYAYIDEQRHHQSTKEDAYWWDDDQIKGACAELIAAGIGTTDATLTWTLFLMANNQEWLKKVTKEIDSVIGSERQPSTRDLPSLPLCEASILETLRWSILAATGIPHSVTEDTELMGYFIPKNTVVLPNLYNITRDPSVWKDPHNFNPAANFLTSDEKEVINRNKFLAFGIGRRSCVGESLARMEITIFFISIFQKYNVFLDPKYGMTPMINGIFRFPGHRILRFQLR